MVVMLPQNEKIGGESGCWRGTKGAAPGPRPGRGTECPRASWGTFYAAVVGGNTPESALGGDRERIFFGQSLSAHLSILSTRDLCDVMCVVYRNSLTTKRKS